MINPRSGALDDQVSNPAPGAWGWQRVHRPRPDRRWRGASWKETQRCPWPWLVLLPGNSAQIDAVGSRSIRSSLRSLVDVADDEEHRAEDRHHVGDERPRQQLRQHLHVVERSRPQLESPRSLLT